MAIRLTCPQCQKSYQVPDEAAGKKATCQQCGAQFRVPTVDVEVAPSGTEVKRYKAAKPFTAPAHYGRHLEALEEHITRHLGEPTSVWHEIVSDKIHLDVIAVPPSKKYPWHTLVTSGMSDVPMSGPGLDPDDRHAEMLICLPATWQVVNCADRDFWPIQWLKQVARLPHDYGTWIGPGHTVPNGDPPEPFADTTKMCCWLIMRPPWFPETFQELAVSPTRTIKFLAMVPLYESEVDLKMNRGLEPLADLLGNLSLTDLMRFDRPNVCAQEFFGRLMLWLRGRRWRVAAGIGLAILFLIALWQGAIQPPALRNQPPGNPHQNLAPPGEMQPGLPSAPAFPDHPGMSEAQREHLRQHQERIEEIRRKAQGPSAVP